MLSFKVKIYSVLFSLLLADAALATQQRQSPIERLRECSTRCQQQQQHQQQQEQLEDCQRRCQDEYKREKEAYGDDDSRIIISKESSESSSRRREEKKENNPFVFEDRHFITGLQTQHGRIRILQKFTDDLLQGIQNYRIAILEADPQTFVAPQHWDAEAVLVVTNGRGTVSFLGSEKRESFNVKQGDVLRIRAGTTTYMINRGNNERLVLVELVQTVNAPGEFEAYFGAGGQNPQSYFSAFSNDILEAVFNVKKEKLQRVFGQQKQGAIIKASQEQIKALSQQEEGGGIWPFGGDSKETVNLYQHRHSTSNQYGQAYEVDSRQYKQLEDLHISVTLANFTQGSMGAPYYNSRATKIAVVLDGEGYLEMACPHLSQREREDVAGPTYEKVSAPLRRGTVVVVPAGHPMVAVASQKQGLQLLSFMVNTRENDKFPLAGKRNVMRQLEREAMELAFGVPAKEVEEVFNSQQGEFFFKGPQQQQQQKGRRSDD